MIVINPKADVFLFNDIGKIYIFLAKKIIEIEDNNNFLMTSFLRWLYIKEDDEDIDKFIKKLSIRAKDELKNAIANLTKKSVLLNKNTFFTQEKKFVNPFFPFRYCENMWGVRNGQRFFFFIAPNQLKATKIGVDIALSWIDEAETGIIYNLLERKIECLPAKISVPKIKQVKLSKGCILIYNSFSKKSKICRKKFFKKTRDFDFWQELIKRATGEIGIVPIVKKVSNKSGPFSLSVHTFLSCHKLPSLKDKNNDWQTGRSKKAKIAKGKSIMEAIERYCGRKKINRNDLIYSSMKKLGEYNCLNPLDIASYSKFQFQKGWLKGIVKFNKNIKTNWARIKNFEKNEFKFIPECFISYYETALYSKKTPRFFFTNSNGMAAHKNVDNAVEKAILEIIERDAILIHWINRISPNKITFRNTTPEFVSNIREKIESIGYQLAILDLTLDTVPVVMSIAYKENGDLNFFCGSAASKSKINAIHKSIKELEFTIWTRLKNLPNFRKEIKKIKIKSIWKPSHHELIYLKQNMAKHLEFLHKGKEIEFNKNELDINTDIFAAIKHIKKEVYYIDLTTKDVQDLGLGIKVVRCILPGFIPITFGYGYEPLAMKRIYDVPLNLGIIHKALCEKDVVENYLPHFFP